MFYRILVAAAAVLVVSPVLAAAEVHAVVSFSILGDMVARVGGDRVAITTIVGPNADTHVYEPKPGDAIAVTDADIFFINGLGFEGWMDRFVESTGYEGPLITVSDRIATHTMDEDGETVTDPHAWQSLGNGMIYVESIAKGLCQVDTAGCEKYVENAAAYSAEITTLDGEIKAQLAAVPAEKRKVITTHDAFGYFGESYGVTFLAPEGVSTESEASAMDVAKLIEQVRSEGVTALFIENMSDPRLLEQIATETGLTVGGELFADALSTAEGPAATYLDMFTHNADLLIPAMRGQ